MPIESPSLDEYLAEVRRTHVNGGVLIGRWRAEHYSDVTAWFAARNRLEEYEMHRLLFDAQSVRSGLEELQIPADLARVPGSLSEIPGGALMLDGMLARVIVSGGAYHQFEGSAAEAKELAARVVDELIGRRYEDIRVDETFEPWTPWFFDIAWDCTLVLTDYARAEMTVLCITDTD
ncbi:hypothetical protein [Oryzihumus leptocrescens]|uniref:Uncharacterized protein n=1 Tax=Oryzihumus leptocrescens TaxID=297536 RepID=A0A542ZIH6_9MICO|nr:hypothetical protein [Oryzihumus leptocrescens]TQL60099.1 hypothetical protein FB474_1479 [Oryzihumus leptocrescens]